MSKTSTTQHCGRVAIRTLSILILLIENCTMFLSFRSRIFPSTAQSKKSRFLFPKFTILNCLFKYFIWIQSLSHRPITINNAHKSCKAFFEEILGDKMPIFKGTESEDFLIIDTPSVTLKHDMINADINGHVGKIISNTHTKPSPRMKNFLPLSQALVVERPGP